MQEIALATDSQLRSIARAKASYEYNSSPHRKTEKKFANMIPVMDSFLMGASTQGTLGQKVVSGGKDMADWGIFIGLAYLYNKAVNKIVGKSETLQNFKENSPAAYGIANVALGATTCMSGLYYIKKGYQKFIVPHLPKNIKNAPENIAKGIDDSSFAKTINNSMKNFAKNYPNITKCLRTGAVWALPVLSLGFIAVWVVDLIKANGTQKRTLKELEAARLAAAQQLAMQNN